MAYLRLEGITKQFGALVANDGISLSVEAGSIHALLGENGAGKTTLMNILAGFYQPDQGQIFLEEKPVHLTSPRVAIQHGIGMIHQHFMLIPQLSVTENIILGTQFSWWLNLRQQAAAIAALSRSYGLAIDPHAQVADLSVSTQQRVEILKALYRRARLLILDEPTAVLTPPEIESFFQVLRQLAAAGHTLIFISHKLEEVMRLCDAVTVLRQGRVVITSPIQAVTPQSLAESMVGREVGVHIQKPVQSPGLPILEIRNLQVRDDRQVLILRNLSFKLYAGEILGVVGVDGNGQRELADAIVGLRSAIAGRIKVAGQDITRWSASQRIQQLGVGYILEDRQQLGLILSFSIARNLILKIFKRFPFCQRGFLQERAIAAHGNHLIQQFDVRAAHSRLQVSQLSGGNQQKLILARELAGSPQLLIAMQPTRGLDVGATEFVQKCLIAERQRGAAILYFSSELEEVMRISDRIAVLYQGEFVEILDASQTTIAEMGFLMTGGRSLE